jgi:hypothetical protein
VGARVVVLTTVDVTVLVTDAVETTVEVVVVTAVHGTLTRKLSVKWKAVPLTVVVPFKIAVYTPVSVVAPAPRKSVGYVAVMIAPHVAEFI